MRDEEDAAVGLLLIAVDAIGDDAQGVDVQAGVGLVHDGELRLEDVELHDLVALLLTTGEALVHGAVCKGLIDGQLLAGLGELLVPLAQLRSLATDSGHGGAHELRHLHARHLSRVLHGKEKTSAGALIDFHLEDVLAVEKHLALGHLVLGVAGDNVGQGGLAGAVGAHDRVGLTGVDGEVDTLEDRRGLTVLLVWEHLRVEILDFQSRH